jgi:hypothetical protein
VLVGHIAPMSRCEVVNQVLQVRDDDRQDLGSISLDERVLNRSATPPVRLLADNLPWCQSVMRPVEPKSGLETTCGHWDSIPSNRPTAIDSSVKGVDVSWAKDRPCARVPDRQIEILPAFSREIGVRYVH